MPCKFDQSHGSSVFMSIQKYMRIYTVSPDVSFWGVVSVYTSLSSVRASSEGSGKTARMRACLSFRCSPIQKVQYYKMVFA